MSGDWPTNPDNDPDNPSYDYRTWMNVGMDMLASPSLENEHVDSIRLISPRSTQRFSRSISESNDYKVGSEQPTVTDDPGLSESSPFESSRYLNEDNPFPASERKTPSLLSLQTTQDVATTCSTLPSNSIVQQTYPSNVPVSHHSVATALPSTGPSAPPSPELSTPALLDSFATIPSVSRFPMFHTVASQSLLNPIVSAPFGSGSSPLPGFPTAPPVMGPSSVGEVLNYLKTLAASIGSPPVPVLTTPNVSALINILLALLLQQLQSPPQQHFGMSTQQWAAAVPPHQMPNMILSQIEARQRGVPLPPSQYGRGLPMANNLYPSSMLSAMTGQHSNHSNHSNNSNNSNSGNSGNNSNVMPPPPVSSSHTQVQTPRPAGYSQVKMTDSPSSVLTPSSPYSHGVGGSPFHGSPFNGSPSPLPPDIPSPMYSPASVAGLSAVSTAPSPRVAYHGSHSVSHLNTLSASSLPLAHMQHMSIPSSPSASSTASSPGPSPSPRGSTQFFPNSSAMALSSPTSASPAAESPRPRRLPKKPCDECLKKLTQSPVDDHSKGKHTRKTPISPAQRSRTKQMYDQYLVDFADAEDEEKAQHVFTHFTLCGGFKKLRQLVGWHNKNHVQRQDAITITRQMDSKFDVLRECVADDSIPLYQFLNAKKTPATRARLDGGTASAASSSSSSSSSSSGPVRRTTAQHRTRPY